jgi:hypothetical protein
LRIVLHPFVLTIADSRLFAGRLYCHAGAPGPADRAVGTDVRVLDGCLVGLRRL